MPVSFEQGMTALRTMSRSNFCASFISRGWFTPYSFYNHHKYNARNGGGNNRRSNDEDVHVAHLVGDQFAGSPPTTACVVLARTAKSSAFHLFDLSTMPPLARMTSTTTERKIRIHNKAVRNAAVEHCISSAGGSRPSDHAPSSNSADSNTTSKLFQ